MGLYQELEERGMIAQATNAEAIAKLLDEEKVAFYIGFDPTADSLHVGHFLQMKIMAHMQQHGHHPIALFGGGTGMIGDPSGKSDMRKMLTRDTIRHNVECFKKQMAKFIDTSEGKATFVDNGDWLLGMNYVDFLRDIGVHFSVNRMLSAECYKSRLERGLTFLEFNYMLMQSYDFYHLNQEYGCKIEFGGDDQWSNIIGGVELVRRKTGKEVYGLTFNLLTNSEGKKMGKTERGAVWLDPEKTPPYEFFQYWRNVGDQDVIKCMKMLTFIPMDEIREYEKLEGAALNRAKETLAYELTKMIHGEDEATKCLEAARAVFGGSGVSGDMPTTELTADDFTDGKILVSDLMVKGKLAASKGEAKRLITQGGITVNDVKISDFAATVSVSDIESGLIVKKGKKVFHRFILG